MQFKFQVLLYARFYLNQKLYPLRPIISDVITSNIRREYFSSRKRIEARQVSFEIDRLNQGVDGLIRASERARVEGTPMALGYLLQEKRQDPHAKAQRRDRMPTADRTRTAGQGGGQ